MRTNTMMLGRKPSTSWFRIDVGEDGLYEVTPTIRLSLELTSAILADITAQSDTHQAPTGILLDVRWSPLLSLVRLSSLIDALNQVNVPLAVLLADESQQRLAVLLHNTVRHRERVAYFVSAEDAYSFVRRHRKHASHRH